MSQFPPGTRFWYHPESECLFTTSPGEQPNETMEMECSEMNEADYLKQKEQKDDEL